MDTTHNLDAHPTTARRMIAFGALALLALPALGPLAAAGESGSDVVVHQYDVGVGFTGWMRPDMWPVSLDDLGTGAGGSDGQVSVGGSWFYDEEWIDGATQTRFVVEDTVFPDADFAFSVNYCTPYIIPGSDDPTDLFLPDLPPSLNEPVLAEADTYQPEWVLCDAAIRLACGDTGQTGIRPGTVAIRIKLMSVEYTENNCGHALVPTQGSITGTFA